VLEVLIDPAVPPLLQPASLPIRQPPARRAAAPG
jgi:hypothetical protein